MHNDFWCELEENKSKQAQSKPEARPIMSILQDLQSVAIEFDISVEVHVVEGLHGDLVSSPILEPIGLILEGKVVLDRASRVSGLLVYARTECRDHSPEGQQDGDCCAEAKEYCRLHPTTYVP